MSDRTVWDLQGEPTSNRSKSQTVRTQIRMILYPIYGILIESQFPLCFPNELLMSILRSNVLVANYKHQSIGLQNKD